MHGYMYHKKNKEKYTKVDLIIPTKTSWNDLLVNIEEQTDKL